MKRQLTQAERSTIESALHSAIITYSEIAQRPDTITHGLASAFQRQAYEADYLVGMLEACESITISNDKASV